MFLTVIFVSIFTPTEEKVNFRRGRVDSRHEVFTYVMVVFDSFQKDYVHLLLLIVIMIRTVVSVVVLIEYIWSMIHSIKFIHYSNMVVLFGFPSVTEVKYLSL